MGWYVPISVNPPTSPWPVLALPPFPTLWVGIAPPGCAQGSQGCVGFSSPDFSQFIGWLINVIFAVWAWFAEWLFVAANWLLYYLVAGLLGVVSLIVNGLLAAMYAYWTGASIVASYTGPFAPITATLALAGFVLVTVFIGLTGLGFLSRYIGKEVSSLDGSGSSGSGGGPDLEEVAEVAA